MNIQEVLKRLQNFDYPVKEYSGLVEVAMEPRIEKNKITRQEIRAALGYEIPLEEIRQIDPWTVVITF